MSNNHNHIVIIIVAIMLFYILTSSGYFAYFGSSDADNKSSTSPKVIISFITVPIVILCIVLLVIQLTKGDSKSAKPEAYKQNEYPHGPPDYPPTPREPPAPSQREPMQPPSEPKIDATGLGEALKDAGWRVVLADWCGFCKRQKELFNEHSEGNFDIITMTEDEAKDNDDVKDRIQGYPAWLNINDKTKESPGYKSSIKEIAGLLQM